ncbi:MAG: PilZ domain-containing protein [Clostridia bacterium]|nr:PilZ domain-containing protein [Deltaproteobacteria bacterium]
MDGSERREFPRLRATAFWKPARLITASARLIDVGLGGVRIYSDEKLKAGKRLDLTFFSPDGEEIEATVRVAWVRKLTTGEAAYDIGLSFETVDPRHVERLNALLAAATA